MPYRKSIYRTLEQFQVNENMGLDDKEASKRLKELGKNELVSQKRNTLLSMFLSQFKDPMVIILIIGAVISSFLQEFLDASIIVAVILLNAIIGVVQEFKAEKAIDALEKLSSPKAYVIRNGRLKEINSSDLVEGDIVELEVGRYVPADLRLISSTNLKVEESTLTGESEAVEKDALALYDDVLAIADQKNMVFMSTYVTYGKAKGVVVRTGMRSEVGKIATLLNEAKQEMTPLQVRLAYLSKILGIISLSICIIMFVVALFQGRNLLDMLILSISLAVAAIPEGLPAVVTIVLALGVQVMSKNHAIVRKLHAVETLGSVSVICSDKTGTLTQNKMHVVHSYASHIFDRYNRTLVHGLALCNDASLQDEEIFGEPTESALLAYAKTYGIDKNELDMTYVRVNEIPFDSKRKCMTTVHQTPSGYLVYTKGALEKVLSMCTHAQIDQQRILLSTYEKNKILEAAKKMSESALRVIALATKTIHDPYHSPLEAEMTFIGCVGLMDPPREDAQEAIALCKEAGIRVVMITGDHPLTAYAIAKQLKITQNQEEVMTGQKLDEMDDDTLQKNVQHYRVFARVTPEHKVRIVNALKKQELVVAMTGDGVNDAPSLKNADIGIAMGKNGTDVCKQAADMILTDDRFSTIVKAVEEGRNIYLNIQKAVLYLLSCNLGEIMALFLSILLMPNVISTLSAIQILWVNLVTDAFPALALGVDPKDQYIMKEKPRSSKESLFAHGGMVFTILNGMFIGTITLVAFRFGLDTSPQLAQTMAFMVLSMSQLFHALNLRSRTHSIFDVGLFKNKWLILTIIFGIGLQILVTELPFFHIILKTTSLNATCWFVVFALSLSILVINEISKWVAKERDTSYKR
ncbi:MAG: calcium-translocating P-type ATPase, PMCA-type [Erysipelotrichaceae bacterium]|nr:calcium-translocating P-type ATPase, PMCA-type [Erysipelotrichaceae bacterium]